MKMMDWLAHNMNATPDQMVNQAIKIYEEQN